MNDTDFHAEQVNLFQAFSKRLSASAETPEGAGFRELAEQFAAIADAPSTLMDDAPPLVYRMLTIAPQLAEHFPRDLLWYLGGECLHFMPDEEIERMAALDERRRAADERGETFNWREARASALRLQ